MGLKVKMVTGDQLAIAQETRKQLGLGRNILDARSVSSRSPRQRSAPQTFVQRESASAESQVGT